MNFISVAILLALLMFFPYILYIVITFIITLWEDFYIRIKNKNKKSIN